MMKLSIKLFQGKKIITSLKSYPWKETFYSLRYLPKVFTKIEKILILFLFGIILFSCCCLIYQSWIKGTKEIANYGGEFREGIVGESKDLDKHLARLINAGLTKYDDNKNIIGDMSESWDIKENGKVYEFHLRKNFHSEDLASQILAKNIWKDINISTPDPSIITFSFKQPFSPFLYASTKPIFGYGPYKIAKESKNEIELVANENYHLGRPYINKIIIKLFNDQKELLKAANRGEIQGFTTNINEKIDHNFETFEIVLPRDVILFFNLSSKKLQDINVRRALKEGINPDKELNLRLVTSDNSKNVSLANSIVEKWQQNGIQVTLDIKDNVSLQKTIIPKRDYDLLLYGLDYGEDPDPYPFWHSSQIKEDGKNLSNFKNWKADRLLEESRQEFDFVKREEKYAEFQKIIDHEIPMFVVEHQNLYYQVFRKVKGIKTIVGSCETDRFLDVASWYIETKRVRK